MERNDSIKFDMERVSTPSFVFDMGDLRYNLGILDRVKRKTGCKILLALKGFAMFHVFPSIRKSLDGVCASSPDETRLGREEFGKEVHTFAAAYSQSDMEEIVNLADHVVFNSFSQWNRFRDSIENTPNQISAGIRVNPEHSEGTVPVYDPCAPGSRLGVKKQDFQPEHLKGISGLHFHTLCEQNADALERTLHAFETSFGQFLNKMSWVNFGGGHHITRKDYDVNLLIRLIKSFKNRYAVQVYLEPGEAVALNAGVLVASVLDIINSDIPIAILDTSAATHMPDVLEMPYRPEVLGSGKPWEMNFTYRLAGLSCLAGDVIGEYSFDSPLTVGDKLVFTDMAHYSMVKTNTFNGLRLPSILCYEPKGDRLKVVRTFGYENYKNRLS